MEVQPLKQSSQSPVPVPPNPAIGHPPVWAQRLLLVIEVAIAVWAGMLVIVLPWTRLWTENHLVLAFPYLRALLNQNFVRGMVSGVGLVDIWIGVWDAVHYRDIR